LVLIISVITTTLKYPDAVGEARMLEPPHDDVSPGVEPSSTGFEFDIVLLSRGRGNGEEVDSI